MNAGFPIARSLRQNTLIAALFYFGVISSGMGQSDDFSSPPRAFLDVPKELFASFCYFDSGVYSPGATFCTKTGTSILCKGPGKDSNFAMWVAVNPDEACKPLPPPAPK